MTNKKNIKSAIITGFILATFSVLCPYIIDPHHINDAKLSPLAQWAILWPLVSRLIYSLDNISRYRKQLDDLNKKNNHNV